MVGDGNKWEAASLLFLGDKMTKRERIEDLGRIVQLIGDLMDRTHNVHSDALGGCRIKDVMDMFNTLPEDKKEEALRTLVYFMEELTDELGEIYSIALGDDD
jgi:hypothetical protein